MADTLQNWKDFISAFKRLFTCKEPKTGIICYPDLSFFNNLSSYMERDHVRLNSLIPTGPASNSGRAGSFFIVNGHGVKVMNAKINVSEYQSVKIVPINPNIQSEKDNFKTNVKGYENIYLDILSQPFINQTYLHCIFDFITENTNMDRNYIKQLSAGVLNGKGITELVISNYGSLYKLLTDWYLKNKENKPINVGSKYLEKSLSIVVSDIVTQLLSVMAYLKTRRYLFNHNDCKTKNIFVHIDGDRAYYQIADYDKSGISYGGYRFRYDEFKEKIYDIVKSGNEIVKSTSQYKISEGLGYIMKTIGSQFSYANIIMLLPIYYMSYDIYTLLLSIIIHPAVLLEYHSGKLPIVDELISILFPAQESKIKIVLHEEHIRVLEFCKKSSLGEYDNFKKDTDYTSIKILCNALTEFSLVTNLDHLYKKYTWVCPTEYDEMYEKVRKSQPQMLQLSSNAMGTFVGNYHVCTDQCKVKKGWTGTYSECPCNKYSSSAGITKTIYDTATCL